MSPSNESGAFLEQIWAEHHELRELLGRTQKMLSARQAAPREAASLVDTTCKHVQRHFQDEEQEGGFFDQIVDDAPRYLRRIESLRDDHTQLAGCAELLISRAKERTGSDDWWNDLEREFHEFCKTLMRHETRENDLLQETYTEDIGAQD